MYQQQRDAMADGNIRAWLNAIAPDQLEEITIIRPSGDTVTLIAARIGQTQVGITPATPGRPEEIMIHVHDTVEDAAACFRHNVEEARAEAAMLNAVAGMPPGPEQAYAAQMLLARLQGDEDTVSMPVSVPPGVREVRTVPPVDDVPTGLYL